MAMKMVMGKVNDVLATNDIEVNLNGYVAAVREKLAFPAKEIYRLGEQLGTSRRAQRLGTKEELVSESGSPFIIHELGLREAIQGLLVEPSQDRMELNFDALGRHEGWRLEGEWFPYELYADDFVFVIDDDGSIFVPTANLPPELQHRASDLLKHIAELLYNRQSAS
jgi:hypothetical protein